MRIARALALAGIDSRRKCERFIEQGEVTLNGEVVRDLGRQVDPEQDEILFRGRPVHFSARGGENFVYYVLHKPVGFVTTASDPHAKKTVFDLLPARLVPRTGARGARTRVFPVGRLDRDSSGLLLFTNDGDLANRLTHPRYGVGKWYEARLNRALEEEDLRKLLQGVRLKDGWAKAEKIKRISRRVICLLMKEGKNREVRRLFEGLDYQVLELARVAFGPLFLGSLPPGSGRFLTAREVRALKAEV